ncbi:hypothetical protein H7J71_25115 [Mycolicibacterium peregrinum]|uniref:DNA primase family protein n=1 Tax=Mycolicibacterium peregrinum TaxID=43304 RepID=UPI0006D7E0D2|nr:phage/plasmid primase, P4 family [Mycolicibacterium peregrinum]MCV7205289.1 hypothetical protein [Mycolicibacterium peregrinum]ORW54811.1 hypothetical protein AWC21_24020 [Mycolicibacterium peregrinum]
MTFAELLELLGYTDTEYVGICHSTNGQFSTAVLPPAAAPAYVDQLPNTADIWYQVNPTAGPVRTNSGRGTADDVTRLAALWCDLDVKTTGCPTMQSAWAIINELANLLGAHPSAIVKSGHGLQPYWTVDDGDITDACRTEMAALLRRWGRLVTLVASHHGSKVDNVYDLPRILRTPGTTNNKNTPVPVTAEPYPGGTPLSLDEIHERLNEAGIYETDADKGESREIVSPPTTWEWGNREMCTYWPTVVDGWKTDNPDARHPWLVSQAVRIAAAHRRGCLDAGQYADAKRILEARFRDLCNRGNDTRKVGVYEFADAIRFGEDQVATMSDERLAAELGKHRHLDEIAGTVTEVDADDIAPTAASNVTQLTRTTTSTTAPTDGQLATVTPITQKPVKVAIDNLTDTGNAELLATAHGAHLRYCPEMGKWLSWDGTCWTVNTDDSAAFTAARAVVGSLDPTLSKDHAKHKLKSLSRTALEAMVALARRAPDMRVELDRLDADPHALNTPAGIVNLRTGGLSPHTATGWHTKTTGVGYNRDLPAPQWHRFLQTTFGGDTELIRYVQRLAGYAAIGEVSEHVLPFLHGGGQNGKSVLLDVLVEVLGDYALTAPSTFLLAGQTKHETEIARLNGARLVVCSEVNKDSRFDEAKLKLLTGGDKLTGRFMHRDFFDFKPTHTLFLMGNHQPEVSAGGHSFWRRLRLIPFRHAVPADERNPNLARDLVDNEGPAILAWIVAGAVDMLTNGIDEPSSVAEATEEYAEQEDALGRFLDECCHVGGGMTVKTKTTVVLARYQRWAKENGAREMNAVTLGRDLSSRFGIKSIKSDSTRFYPGLALVVEDNQQTGGWGQ